MAVPVQVVVCPSGLTTNVQNVPVGQGGGNFNWALMGILAATTSSSAAITTTDTVIAGGSSGVLIPTFNLNTGQLFRAVLRGTCTSTQNNVGTMTLRYGSAGTTADASVATFAVSHAAAGTSIGFCYQLEWIITATGTTGQVQGGWSCWNSGTTGIDTLNANAGALTTTATLNTGVASYWTISYKASASFTTSSVTFGPPCLIQAC